MNITIHSISNRSDNDTQVIQFPTHIVDLIVDFFSSQGHFSSSFSLLYLILHNFTCMYSVVKHSSCRLYVFTLTIYERGSNVRVYLSFLRPLGFFFFYFFPFCYTVYLPVRIRSSPS